VRRVYANVRGLLRANLKKRDPASDLLEVLVAGGALVHGSSDVQKLADKLLARVLDAPALGPVDALKDAGERLRVLAVLVPTLPGDALSVLPTLVPEAVLDMKQPSELAPGEASALVVAMGERMLTGGTVRRLRASRTS
jgi:ribosomal RNA-processing protein 12